MDETAFSSLCRDYYRIETAIHFLQEHFREHPSLDDVAASCNLSKYHFHRLFKRWAGLTPERFLGYLTLEFAKESLDAGQSVLSASLESGLSGPGRLHDLFVSVDAVTPGEYKAGGQGIVIEYAVCPTPLGLALVAVTSRGICHLGFVDPRNIDAAVAELWDSWPKAEFRENRAGIAELADRLFPGERIQDTGPFHLYLKGTNFQVKVWQALLTIPPGVVISYGNLAAYIGAPRAVRAVAGAVASNPVSLLIPCHRVIGGDGRMHGYRWGIERKMLILAREAIRSDRRFQAGDVH